MSARDRHFATATELGLHAGASYEEVQYDFQVGDAVLLYTDCAVALKHPLGVKLGTEGLIRLCQELDNKNLPDLEQLEQALLAYTSRVHLEDDLTLVALKRNA